MSNLSKRRKELKSALVLIEKQIYDLETNYLEESKEFGNIFVGWDAYLSIEKVKIKKHVNNDDRLFSLTSMTSPATRKDEAKKIKHSPDGNLRKGRGGRKRKSDVDSNITNVNHEVEESSKVDLGYSEDHHFTSSTQNEIEITNDHGNFEMFI